MEDIANFSSDLFTQSHRLALLSENLVHGGHVKFLRVLHVFLVLVGAECPDAVAQAPNLRNILIGESAVTVIEVD